MIVLHHPTSKDAVNLRETWEFVEKYRERFNITTRMVDKSDDASPSHFMDDYWRYESTLVWLCHDVVPTPEMIDELINCKYSLCAQAAVLSPIHTGLPGPVLNCRVRDSTGTLRWIREGEEWADFFATDLVKFSPEFQATIKVPECSWRVIDNEMSKLAEVRTHVHFPTVRHNQG